MTNETKTKVILYGIKVKLNRGELLDDILKGYTKLTVEEKNDIIKKLQNERGGI